jgi:hypothetical protein
MSLSRAVALMTGWQPLSLTGCTSYRQIGLDEVSDYGKVRVTFADGERRVVLTPLTDATPNVRPVRPRSEVIVHGIKSSSVALRFLLPISLVFWLAACHKWVPVQESPVAALRELADQTAEEHTKVRLHLGPDYTVAGWVSGIVNDSVLIRDRRVDARGNAAIPVESVLRLDVQEGKPAATGALVGGVILVALGVVAFTAFAVAMSSGI